MQEDKPNHSEVQFERVESQLNVLKTRFFVVTALFVGLGILNVAFLLIVQSNLLKPAGSDITAVSQLDIKPVIKKEYQSSIKTFYNNAAVSEVAYQLELKRQSVSTKTTTNCFTPEVPPIQNGCSFVVRPYATGISSKASYLNKIIFNAQMGSEDRIAIDIKDIDKNEIQSQLGVILGKQAVRELKLPPSLQSNQQLFIRLWPVKGSSITIDEVLLESFSADQLQPVNITVPNSLKGKVGSIYLDYDNNKKFDLSIDIEWNCRDGFAGINGIIFTDLLTISLARDDRCVTQNAPSSWSKDAGKNALAPYWWLLVIPESTSVTTVFSFEVTKDKNNFSLN